MPGSGNTSTRGNVTSSSSDMPPLSQWLSLDPITLGNQKCIRTAELSRVLEAPLPQAIDELKNLKESLQDSLGNASDRAEFFRQSIVGVDKLKECLNSKKRKRSDISSTGRSSGKNSVKMGTQIQRNTQRLEDRTKNLGMNKRARTSVADVQGGGRVSATSRQNTVTEKDGDVLPAASGATGRVKEKTRRLPVGGEGLDRKIKKKRFVGAVGNRIINGDREPQACDAQAIRPKVQEENSGSTSGTMLKGKATMAPRTSSTTVLDSSSKAHPSFGAFQGREQPTGPNKVPGVTNNLKRPMSAALSSHALAQWGGQRPRKILRTSRENLVSPVSNNEAQLPSQDISTSDLNSRTSFGNNGFSSSIDNSTPKLKRDFENVSSPFGLSESEESGDGEYKPKEKGIDSGDGALPVAQKVRSFKLPTRKNKTSEVGNGVRRQGRSGSSSSFKRDFENVSSPFGLSESEEPGDGEFKPKEKGIDSGDGALPVAQKVRSFKLPTRKNKTSEVGNGVRRQGRSGSSSSLTRPSIRPTKEKLENLPTTRPLLKVKPAPDKIKSKSGRPPPKNLKDRKASIRVGMTPSSVTLDFTGESDDDHEELLAAANAARNASSLACSGPFWKKMEPVFAPVSSEDMSYLKQQSNQETAKTDALCGMGKLDTDISLYQRVLSTLIEEEESEALSHASDDSHYGSCNQIDIEPKDEDRMESEVESNVDFQSDKSGLLDRISCKKSAASNCEQWLGNDDISHSDSGLVSEICSSGLAQLQPRELNVPGLSSPDCQYERMSLDDKLLLELHSVGIYPETQPALAEGKEVINQDIMDLNEELNQLIERKKKSLSKIDKAIQKTRDDERRSIEHGAMDQLVEMACKRRKACRGNNTSKSVLRKVSRQAAAGFGKRTLTRCRKFEATGISCFSEPALQDVLFSTPPCSNDAKSADCVGSGSASNNTFERHDIQSDNLKLGTGLNKGKRNERGMTQKKDNSVNAHLSLDNSKTEHKAKTRTKSENKNNNNSSTSEGNESHDRFTGSGSKSPLPNSKGKNGREVESSKEKEEQVDIGNLGLEAPQDLDKWLEDCDAVEGDDSLALGIPMDDLSTIFYF